MSFTCADIERFYDAREALPGKWPALAAAWSARDFGNEAARAFATQGFPGRLELMQKCIDGAMEAFPPRISWVPDPFMILEATIYLQAFVTNVRGCVDNLAHAWVRERGLTGEDGAPLAGAQVGFGPGNGAVLDSLSPEFAGYLRGLAQWFDHLERFRHALEHEVPLYVPRSTVPDGTLREFGELGRRIVDAERSGDRGLVDRLTRERCGLVSFFPIVEHALGANAEMGVFHFQMVEDFQIVVEIAERLLLEFD